MRIPRKRRNSARDQLEIAAQLVAKSIGRRNLNRARHILDLLAQYWRTGDAPRALWLRARKVRNHSESDSPLPLRTHTAWLAGARARPRGSAGRSHRLAEGAGAVTWEETCAAAASCSEWPWSWSLRQRVHRCSQWSNVLYRRRLETVTVQYCTCRNLRYMYFWHRRELEPPPD